MIRILRPKTFSITREGPTGKYRSTTGRYLNKHSMRVPQGYVVRIPLMQGYFCKIPYFCKRPQYVLKQVSTKIRKYTAARQTEMDRNASGRQIHNLCNISDRAKLKTHKDTPTRSLIEIISRKLLQDTLRVKSFTNSTKVHGFFDKDVQKMFQVLMSF